MATRSILLATLLSGLLAYSFYLWAKPPASLTVQMETSEQLRVDGEILNKNQALTVMRQAVADDPDIEITIQVPAEMPAGDVIALTQDLETLGGQIDIETREIFD